MSKITVLEAQNFKRLTAVRIEPHPAQHTVVLNGKNGAGKSATLDAIQAVLGGKEESPDVPIREGERKATARVGLSNGLVAERTWTAKGTQLVLRNADGTAVPSPQTRLNELFSKRTIDPLAFASLKGWDQAATLKRIVGLDFAALDAERKGLYDQRKEVNRRAKDLTGQLKGLPPRDPEAPGEEVSVGELLTAHMEAQEAHTAHEARKRTVAETRMGNENLAARIEKHRVELNRLEESLRQRKAWIETELAALTKAEAELPDLAALNEQVAKVEETNRSVRANAQRAHVEALLSAASASSDNLTRQIEQVDEQKAAKLEAAEFPVEGLGFDDQGVTFNGLPFEQASHAERLRVSTAIGLALNPELKVLLIRDAEKLDQEGMALMSALAQEHDAQLWLERAGHEDAGAIVIEDGGVRGAP